MLTNDLGNTGTGGPLSDTDQVTINVNALNTGDDFNGDAVERRAVAEQQRICFRMADERRCDQPESGRRACPTPPGISRTPAISAPTASADILWRHDNGQVVLWQMDGATILSNQSVATIGNDWHNEGVADFGGDGRADVLWRNDSGQVALWTMDGAQITNNQLVGNLGRRLALPGTAGYRRRRQERRAAAP